MRRLTLLALVVPLTLSACTGDPDSDVADPTSPPVSSSPPTTEPTTSEPAEPTTSATPEPEPLGPEATVRAWVEARNEVVVGAPPTAVYALSTAECSTCKDIVEPVLEVYRSGGRLETTGWSVEKAKRTPEFRRNKEVTAGVIYAAGRTFPSEGAQPIDYGEERHLMAFTMSNEDGVWLVDRIEYYS